MAAITGKNSKGILIFGRRPQKRRGPAAAPPANRSPAGRRLAATADCFEELPKTPANEPVERLVAPKAHVLPHEGK